MGTLIKEPTLLRRDVYERVLERFGFDTIPDPSLETLNRLYKAWCRNVGYDNVLKRIYFGEGQTGPFPVMDPNDYLSTWMKHGTSGSCWPTGEAMFGLLELTGYDVERVAGQMLDCDDPMNPNHGSVMVHYDSRKFYVDPSIGAEQVLEIVDGTETRTDSKAFGIWCMGDGRVWWQPGHSRRAIEIALDLDQLSCNFFAYRYEKTKEFSLFNTTLYVRRNRDDGILTYGRGNILRVDPEGDFSAEPIEQSQLAAFLIEQMGLSEEIVSRVPLVDAEGANFE